MNLRTTNCANFVSQCLTAGGVGYTDEWYHNVTEYKYYDSNGLYGGSWFTYDYSLSWSMASKQYEYFSNPENGYINSSEIIIENESVTQLNNGALKITSAEGIKAVASEGNVQIGDLVYFINEVGTVHHAAIVSNVEDGDIKYAGNTKRRFDASLSATIGPDGEYGVVIVRINDELEIK